MKNFENKIDKGMKVFKISYCHLTLPKPLSLLVAFLLLFSTGVYAQETEISGTVVDSDGIPMPGANIVEKGTTNGAQTDFDGNYSIEVDSNGTLTFSYIGYASQEIPINNQSNINVVLQEDFATLDEVVVTGYGKQSRAKLTTSVAKLDTRILETSSRSNAATALQGTIAGLRVTNTTGQPGSTPNIILRGGTNFDGSGSPLILIDGIPGSFYALYSDYIESIEVLKDAAATAIYGARSANGVVLVTTKSGKVGRSNI